MSGTPPTLRLVRGNPTPEELGAVVALLASRGGGEVVEEAPEPRSLWARPQLRASLQAGPGAWRASGLPQ